jgi:hypothetical protein
MTHKKITDLTADTSPQPTDLVHIVDDISGTPTNKKVTYQDFVDAITLTVATLDDTGTPSVSGGQLFKTGGTTAITDFDDGVVGQTIRILAAHAITITDGTPIILNGSANFVMAAADTLTLTMFDDQVWQEVSRMVNL